MVHRSDGFHPAPAEYCILGAVAECTADQDHGVPGRSLALIGDEGAIGRRHCAPSTLHAGRITGTSRPQRFGIWPDAPRESDPVGRVLDV